MKEKSNIYIYYLAKNVNEGGMARTNAFKTFCIDADKEINVFTESKISRLILSIRVFIILFFFKDKNIFIHQGAFLFCFPNIFLRFKIYNFIFLKFVKRMSSRNKIVFEVNDLPYEQAIDLDLGVKYEDLIFQTNLYGVTNIKFIFASKLMKDYAINKYKSNAEICISIVNGANELEECYLELDFLKDFKSKIKYVYSGTLNKGRDIEKLINIFKEKDSVLILLGTDGEWLKDYDLPESVKYIGSYKEDVAHYIVSQCDVGILHYDSKKLYYNICFPTKASFYVSAGLAVLSTPLDEMKNTFDDTFIFSDFEDFEAIIESLNINTITEVRAKTGKIKKEFYWITLLSELKYF